MEILKVKDWLELNRSDYEGFLAHVKVWDKIGIAYGFNDLLKIAKAYNIKTPILPSIIDNKVIF